MEKLLAPPQSFAVDPILRTCQRGTRLTRIYFRAGAHPTAWNAFRSFGPTSSRFDHHTEPRRVQTCSILYASASGALPAFAEVFQETRTIDRKRNDPWLAVFDLVAAVDLLDTTGHWPVRAGGNLSINTGERALSRAWSRAVYASYSDVAGIWYPSSMTGDACVALYERAKRSVPLRPVLHEPLSSPKLEPGILSIAQQLYYMVT